MPNTKNPGPRFPPLPEALPEWVAWILLAAGLLVLVLRFDDATVPTDRLFHPEAIYPIALYLDLGDWASWTTPMTPYFVPDLPLAFFCTWITGNPVAAVYAFGVLQFTLLVAAARWLFGGLLAREDPRRRHVERQSVLVGVWLLVFFALGFHARGLLLLLFTAAFHTGAFLLALAAQAILFRSLEPSGKVALRWGLFLICFLGTLSDKLFLSLFVFPAIATLALFFRRLPSRTVRLALGIAVAGWLGYSSVDWINAAGTIKIAVFPATDLARTLESLRALASAHYAETLVDRFFATLGWPYRFFWFSWIVLVLFSIYALRRQRNVLFFSIFTLSAFASTALVSFYVAIGPYSSSFERPLTVFVNRYLSALYCIPLLSLALYLPVLLPSRILNKSQLAQAVVLGGVLIGLLFQTGLPSSFPRYWPEDVTCLDEKAAEYDLRYGLAFFYKYPRVVNVFSRRGLHVDQVSEKLEPMTWIDSRERAGQASGYDFVIVNQLRQESAVDRWGRPDHEINCHGMNVFVYDEPVFAASSAETPRAVSNTAAANSSPPTGTSRTPSPGSPP